VIILDDPFSALDEDTATSLRNFLIQFILIEEKRSIILATHTLHLLNHSLISQIILIKQGEEIERNTYGNLVEQQSSYFLSLLDDQKSLLMKLTQQRLEEENKKKLLEDQEKSLKVEVEETWKTAPQGEDEQLLEKTQTGLIESRVYWSYFRACGFFTTFLTVLSTFLMQASNIGMSFWLGYWSTHQNQFTDTEFLKISSVIIVCCVVFTFLRSILFAYGGLKSAYKLYYRLANSVMATDIHFFEKTSIGQIVNRFGKDTNTVDDNLPFIMNIFLAQTFMLLGACFLMCFNDPMIILLLIIIFSIYYRVQRFYRLTSRELRRLDSIYKSPIYTVFTDCMNGSIELRSLGEKNIHFYLYKLQKYLNDSMRVSFANSIASSWLNFRMQLLGSVITTLLALSIVLNNFYHLLPLSPGLAGLSLIYSFSIVNNLNGFINSMTETEQEMISVERVLEYSDLPSEFTEDSETIYHYRLQHSRDYHGGKSTFCFCCSKKKNKYNLLNTPDGDGAQDELDKEQATNLLTDSLILDQTEAGENPAHHNAQLVQDQEKYWNYISTIIKDHLFFVNEGIHFHNVYMRYPSSSEDALREITLYLPKGSRAVIVGRTGSGKSSLLRLLLRMNDYYSGSITYNSIELKTISKQLLRKTATILPQKPLLLTGTLKLNVDPLNLYSDEEIMIALYESSFLTTIRTISQEVNTDFITESGRRTTSTERIVDWTKGGGVDTTIQNVLLYPITEGGNNLSWGQKQLLCLARAILRKSDLILIDEVSASLDNETKLLVFSALERHLTRQPSTILLMISHHLEGLDKLCNQVKLYSRIIRFFSFYFYRV
jgi:ABC-type multidrug transport system fused ATPase/permease subunit